MISNHELEQMPKIKEITMKNKNDLYVDKLMDTQ